MRPFAATEALPEGMEWCELHCTERTGQSSQAHICPEGQGVGICGRQAWKANMSMDVIYYHPRNQCPVCVQRAREMMGGG